MKILSSRKAKIFNLPTWVFVLVVIFLLLSIFLIYNSFQDRVSFSSVNTGYLTYGSPSKNIKEKFEIYGPWKDHNKILSDQWPKDHIYTSTTIWDDHNHDYALSLDWKRRDWPCIRGYYMCRHLFYTSIEWGNEGHYYRTTRRWLDRGHSFRLTIDTHGTQLSGEHVLTWSQNGHSTGLSIQGHLYSTTREWLHNFELSRLEEHETSISDGWLPTHRYVVSATWPPGHEYLRSATRPPRTDAELKTKTTSTTATATTK